MAHKRFFIQLGSGGVAGLGGGFKYAFWAEENSYKNIDQKLGVKEPQEGEKGLVFGANSPKPPVVYLKLDNGKTARRFCDPDSLGDVLNGSLNGSEVSPGLFGLADKGTVVGARV